MVPAAAVGRQALAMGVQHLVKQRAERRAAQQQPQQNPGMLGRVDSDFAGSMVRRHVKEALFAGALLPTMGETSAERFQSIIQPRQFG